MLDNDCDGEVDENPNRTWYADTDGDLRGDPDSVAVECESPTGYVSNANDCDDSNNQRWTDADDNQCDEIDNDCDGDVDEDATDVASFPHWYPDGDGDGFGNAAAGSVQEYVSDKPGYVTGDPTEPLSLDCDDLEMSVNPNAQELCNGEDDNCDEVVDESCPGAVVIGGTITDSPLFGTSTNSDEVAACPVGQLLVGLRYRDSSNYFLELEPRCATPDIDPETGEVSWTGAGATNTGASIGSDNSTRSTYDCPADTFITEVRVKYRTIAEDIERLEFECSSLSGQQSSVTLTAVAEADLKLLKNILGPYGFVSPCPEGEVASGFAGSSTDTRVETLALQCRDVNAQLLPLN